MGEVSPLLNQQGYWRSSPQSQQLYRCVQASQCHGTPNYPGNETGNAACNPGSTGPLCAVCQPGSFSFGGQCKCAALGGAALLHASYHPNGRLLRAPMQVSLDQPKGGDMLSCIDLLSRILSASCSSGYRPGCWAIDDVPRQMVKHVQVPECSPWGAVSANIPASASKRSLRRA